MPSIMDENVTLNIGSIGSVSLDPMRKEKNTYHKTYIKDLVRQVESYGYYVMPHGGSVEDWEDYEEIKNRISVKILKTKGDVYVCRN